MSLFAFSFVRVLLPRCCRCYLQLVAAVLCRDEPLELSSPSVLCFVHAQVEQRFGIKSSGIEVKRDYDVVVDYGLSLYFR
ncbi:hypothetical protein BVRB_1g016250 [Beta vulgaris subsp. vulgaris]|nr:hypothetical protein BVRB_1g016250 [Beta vulgaris subsp. vulgaris]